MESIITRRFDELTLGELYDMLRCRTEVFVVEQNCVYQDMDEADLCCVHVFMKERERIVAYLRVLEPGVKFDDASIGRFLIVKEYRQRGMARPMMAKAIEIATRMSAHVTIEAQTYLRPFYESLGFTATSEEYIHEQRPHILMRL